MNTDLTDMEKTILRWVAAGADNQTIAAQVHLAKGTVGNYIWRICRKLGASNRAHAVHIGWQHGLLGGAS